MGIPKPELEIRLVSEPATLELIRRLRIEVWTQTPYLRAFVPDLSTDEHDSHAFHWAVFEQGELVGAARLCVHDRIEDIPDYKTFPPSRPIRKSDLPVASMNRLVLAANIRRRGIPKLLDQARIEKALALGARAIILKAAPGRVKGMQKLGFRLVSDHIVDRATLEPGAIVPDSKWMIYTLTSDPR